MTTGQLVWELAEAHVDAGVVAKASASAKLAALVGNLNGRPIDAKLLPGLMKELAPLDWYHVSRVLDGAGYRLVVAGNTMFLATSVKVQSLMTPTIRDVLMG